MQTYIHRFTKMSRTCCAWQCQIHTKVHTHVCMHVRMYNSFHFIESYWQKQQKRNSICRRQNLSTVRSYKYPYMYVWSIYTYMYIQTYPIRNSKIKLILLFFVGPLHNRITLYLWVCFVWKCQIDVKLLIRTHTLKPVGVSENRKPENENENKIKQ